MEKDTLTIREKSSMGIAVLDTRPRLIIGLDFGTTWSGFVDFYVLVHVPELTTSEGPPGR